jgi:SpoVK/Ycf46/Vps4 family AAA+-type ATPase
MMKGILDEGQSYQTPLEHLQDELRWLNRKIAVTVMQLRAANFYEEIKDFGHLFITDKEVDELLSEGDIRGEHKHDEGKNHKIIKLQQLAQNMRNYIDRRLQESIQQNYVLPIVQLRNLFHLSNFDIQVLIICIAPYIDARYERLYAYLQNDINKKLPSRDLIIALLLVEDESKTDYISAFDKASPLINYNLLIDNRSETETQFDNVQFQADLRIVKYILYEQAVDEQLTGKLRLFQPLQWEQVVVEKQFKIRLWQFINYEFSNHTNVCLYLHGNSGLGKKTIARALCSDLNVLFAVVDFRELLHAKESFQPTVKRILREGILQPCAICFDHVEALQRLEIEIPGIIKKFVQFLQETNWVTFLCSENPLSAAFLEMARIYPIEIKRPVYEEQISLWKLYLDKSSVDCDLIEIQRIAARFDLSGGQIVHAIQEAEKIAYIRNPDHSRLTYNDLVKCCRLHSQPKMMSLAKKIEPQYQWQDLVLPEDQIAQLQEMANQVKHRHKVLDEWGFACKISLGLGISALFSGPSGTGKTMAAEVIGHELNMDLYKIDLSTVVSKYIGETEKNLNRLFIEAEHSNSILFFDEADAIFGKRSEVKDAHDRFANIEVAYLLQKMEEYEGVTILSTNLKKNLDTAFVRRLQFIVDFPAPDEEQREKIWRQIFPPQAPLDTDVDFPLLADKFKITGGNIKNIAVRSAYLAAHEETAISMKHIVLAAKRELQKIGVIFSKTEFFELL